MEISEVVNLFQSEAVQVKVVEKLLDVMIEFEKNDTDGYELFIKKGNKRPAAYSENYPDHHGRKKPGATRILNQLLVTDFF